MEKILLLLLTFCNFSFAKVDLTDKQKIELVRRSVLHISKFKTVGEVLNSNKANIDIKKSFAQFPIESLPMPKIIKRGDFEFLFDWGSMIVSVAVDLRNDDVKFKVNGQTIIIRENTTLKELISMNVNALPKLVGTKLFNIFVPEAFAQDMATCGNAQCAGAVSSLIAFEIDTSKRIDCSLNAVGLYLLKNHYEEFERAKKDKNTKAQIEVEKKIREYSKELEGKLKKYFEDTEDGQCEIPPITYKMAKSIVDKFPENKIPPSQIGAK